MKPVAIFQNDRHDGPAFFATWLTREAIPFQVFALYDGAALPTGVQDFSGLCVLGGPQSANDALPYYPDLLDQLRQAVGLRIPVIGHCLGGQLLSRALGATVQAADHTEIGWSVLHPLHPHAQDWFGDGPLQLFQWHGESFGIPAGATPLLRGDYCANQAYVVDERHLAMQFHCEVDSQKLRLWLELGAEEVRRCASPAAQDAASMLAHLNQHMARSQAIASHIYSRWAQGLAR